MADRTGQVLLDAALAVLVDRAGGSIELTQTDFHAVKARRGPYRIVGRVDKSGPGEPVIRVSLDPSTDVDHTPVS